jgi:hypothetical protein
METRCAALRIAIIGQGIDKSLTEKSLTEKGLTDEGLTGEGLTDDYGPRILVVPV